MVVIQSNDENLINYVNVRYFYLFVQDAVEYYYDLMNFIVLFDFQ
jgi:hypothetical protein